MYLETERMVVRDFTMDDAADLQEIFGDQWTMKNCEPAYDFEKTKRFLSEFCVGKHGAVLVHIAYHGLRDLRSSV